MIISKYRIIEDSNGNFKVQYKFKGMLQPWRNKYIDKWEFEEKDRDKIVDGMTKLYFIAENYVNKCLHEERKERRSKKFKVITEVEV